MMKTSDDHHVSCVTLMCDYHGERFAAMAALVLDNRPGGAPQRSEADQLTALHEYLAEGRAECIEQCGRVDE